MEAKEQRAGGEGVGGGDYGEEKYQSQRRRSGVCLAFICIHIKVSKFRHELFEFFSGCVWINKECFCCTGLQSTNYKSQDYRHDLSTTLELPQNTLNAS